MFNDDQLAVMDEQAYQNLRKLVKEHKVDVNYALARQVYAHEQRPEVCEKLRRWVCGITDEHG